METGAISHSEILALITDEDGSPLPGVVGTLKGAIISPRDQVSNAEGRMVFRDLPPGTYQIHVSLGGFKDSLKEVTISKEGQTESVEIAMTVAEV